MKIIKPAKLKTGDVVGIIAPASSPIDPMKLENGIRYLERNGYRVELGKNVNKIEGYLAGTDQERADDLNSMFKNINVKAIFCVRGGYGASRILDKINYKLIRANPKILVGYSEITSLQMAILQNSGLVTFAGPMIATDFGDGVSSYTEEFFWRLISSNKKIGRLKYPDNNKLVSITRGGSSGRIIGGNLSVLAALIGTQYFPDLKNRILMLEEVDELPYKVDRLLNHFRLMKIFNQVKGIILGRFVDCYESDTSKRTLTLGEVMEHYMKNLKIPVLYTFPHGHIKDKITVPLGINVKMNAAKGFVEYLEGAVK